MRVLVDMNLSPAWTHILRQAGMEAAHWSTLGAADATDREIMSFARHRNYIVLTHDLDFSAILAATNGKKPSVAQIRADDVSPRSIGAAVVKALLQMTSELDQGALLTIEPARSRLRLLPLQS